MAVYTELSAGDINALLETYDLPPLAEASGIASGVENTNYRLTMRDGSRYILTLFEKRVKVEDLPFFVALMQRLAGQGIPCPMPVTARNGEALASVKDKPSLIVTFLPGKSALSLQPVHLRELGAGLAKLHLAASGLEGGRENALSFSGWNAVFGRIQDRLDTIAPGLALEIEAELRALAQVWPQGLPEGIIHADAFPDNIFYDERDRLSGIIDFYFACRDLLAYELAICLNAWCFERNGEFNITRAKHLLMGYNDIRPMSEAELDALPVLAQGAALRFFLTRAHDWLFPVEGALVTPKDPLEYLKKLRFHRAVAHHREYGL